MPAISDVLNRLLRLGEEISTAVTAENWSRVEDLVERRTEVAQRLEEADDQAVEADLSEAEQQEKLEALDEQKKALTALLRKQRDEIEDELSQIEQMRNAQDSYESNASRSGVLPNELRG